MHVELFSLNQPFFNMVSNLAEVVIQHDKRNHKEPLTILTYTSALSRLVSV